MPHYKLTYFNGRGRAELVRLILHYAGIEFEDCRMEREEWPAIKPTTPFGQVPVLEIDGAKMLAQSNAIARYLALQHGLAGKDAWEHAQADMYVDCIVDLMQAGRPVYLEKDPEKQKELMESFVSGHVVPHLSVIESHLEKNGGVLVGSDISWADIAYYTFFSFAGERFGDVTKNCPHLKDLMVRIEAHDSVKKYLEKRPVTAM